MVDSAQPFGRSFAALVCYRASGILGYFSPELDIWWRCLGASWRVLARSVSDLIYDNDLISCAREGKRNATTTPRQQCTKEIARCFNPDGLFSSPAFESSRRRFLIRLWRCGEGSCLGGLGNPLTVALLSKRSQKFPSHL